MILHGPLRAGALVRDSGRETPSLDALLAGDQFSVTYVDFEQLSVRDHEQALSSRSRLSAAASLRDVLRA